MRDNHQGMPEILEVYNRDGLFYGVIAITLSTERQQFEFGLPQADYKALKRILESRPFDQLPGLKYRYFVSSATTLTPEKNLVEISIRVEQGRNVGHLIYEVPISLAANLLWFAHLKDFSMASHLKLLKPIALGASEAIDKS